MVESDDKEVGGHRDYVTWVMIRPVKMHGRCEIRILPVGGTNSLGGERKLPVICIIPVEFHLVFFGGSEVGV